MYRTILAPGAIWPITPSPSIPPGVPSHGHSVYLCVLNNPGMTISQIATAVEKARRTVDAQIIRMIDNGLFVKVGKRIYPNEEKKQIQAETSPR